MPLGDKVLDFILCDNILFFLKVLSTDLNFRLFHLSLH